MNKFGIQVGDLFVSQWGYEQTNVTFFQVVKLLGKTSVRVREVIPAVTEEKIQGALSADRSYQNSIGLLPARAKSVFIKDQEGGDIKRLKMYSTAGMEPQFSISDYANAYLYRGEKLYESCYY